MVKGLNIDFCIQGGRMFFSLVSVFQTAAVLHKHLGVPNTKKTDTMELNKRLQPTSRHFSFFFSSFVYRHSCVVLLKYILMVKLSCPSKVSFTFICILQTYFHCFTADMTVSYNFMV